MTFRSARRLMILGALAAGLAWANPASATPTSGELFFTTFSPVGGSNVFSVDYSFDGAAVFSLSAPAPIGLTPGADGIAGNPQNADLLIVGGQGPDISNISKSTGTVSTVASPVNVFHLEVPSSNLVLGSGIPGAIARHPIAADGSLGPGTAIPIVGVDTAITQVIDTPSGFFYTASGPGGIGTYGTLTFDTGDPATATSATSTRLHGTGGSISSSNLEAAHGGVFDPFTNTVIIMGDGHVTQLDLAGNIVSDRNFAGFNGVFPNFDQGTVDGLGHLFVASNTGHLLFIDYGVTGLIGDLSNFGAIPFLIGNLDDVAPLVGEGSTVPTPAPEPVTGLLLGSGLAALGLVVWRRRRTAR